MIALQALRAPLLMTAALALAFALALFLCGYATRAVIRMDGGIGKPYSSEGEAAEAQPAEQAGVAA